jgi:outer membrane protein assembly factor BamB
VDAKTGQKVWKFNAKGWVWSSPAFVDGLLYVGSGSGSIYAVDARTGQEVWSFKTKRPVYSSPVVADGVVYAGSTDGTLYALY